MLNSILKYLTVKQIEFILFLCKANVICIEFIASSANKMLLFLIPPPPHFCGSRVIGEGAKHNNLRAKILFLALVSNSNATASSLLSQDPNWILD